MNLHTLGIHLVERLPWPDRLTSAAIAYLVGRTGRRLHAQADDVESRFVAEMARHPIAVQARKANDQHYELPADFFALMLGPQRKYSCCLYDDGIGSLASAEEHALAQTAAHADLADGQSILELGCGWGSLSLWMAARFPRSRILAVSNSHSQRAFIEVAAGGMTNLDVVTADMNNFDPGERFDRIVSVEMFEHMSNWGALLRRARDWLTPGGRLFLHVFSHQAVPYRFETVDPADWIAQHFFTGGIMPSHRLIRHFDDAFAIEREWRWCGRHYERTARDWLANFDANTDSVRSILNRVYGGEAALWHRRWRLFLLATIGLFGHRGGTEWGVSHYRLRPTPQRI